MKRTLQGKWRNFKETKSLTRQSAEVSLVAWRKEAKDLAPPAGREPCRLVDEELDVVLNSFCQRQIATVSIPLAPAAKLARP